MKINKTTKCLHFALLILIGALTAAAQGFSVPSGRTTNFIDWNESFEGTTGSSGTETVLNSTASFHFGRFSVGAGIPVYFNRSVSPSEAMISDGIGDAFVRLGSTWNGSLFNSSTALTVAAPTGNPDKGFGTGHTTFDLTSRIDHDFGFIVPFIDGGVANTISDTEFFHRPFTSYGYLAHFEVGANVAMPHSVTLLLSEFEIAPWGTQTIISRDVVYGATGSGGLDGRVWEVNHLTTGPAYINHDDGFTAGLKYSPKPYLNLALGYTRSMSFSFNTFSWGVGVNMSRVISGGKSTR